MKLIRVDELTGKQYQYSLPLLENESIEVVDADSASSSKQERINRMIKTMAKASDKQDEEIINRIEPNYIYASISGYEYIKMNIVEFHWFVNIVNALIEIDSDEFGFYGINIFIAKERDGINSSNYELVQFEYMGFPSTISGLTDALRAGHFDGNDPHVFFDNIRYLG